MSSIIQIKDKQFKPFLSELEIANAIQNIAQQVNRDYNNEEVVFVAILNGAFMFASDFIKNISLNCEITFVKVSSYIGTESSGRVDEIIGLTKELKGKNVVILEDIVDTGITMDKVYKLLEMQEPKSLKICTLLYKKEAHKGKNIPDYVAFEIENKFVVGYGLDYDEAGRNLKEIFQVNE
ncbi:MAG: hypoxanthine phosphoribosyltransferase [Crocinitomicaceae bacterium]